MKIELPKNYQPSKDEPFMNENQKEYFRCKLEKWKDQIQSEIGQTVVQLQKDSTNHPDVLDQANFESEKTLELRTRDRQRKLIVKIEEALKRIEDNEYGYCEETGEPISIKRLEARPIATFSVESQERHEKRERVYK